MSLDYPILPICQTAESFRNILSAMGPYRDSISLKKSPLLGLYTGSEAQLDLATVRYHALGAYAKSVYLVFIWRDCIHPVYTNQLYRKVMKWHQLDSRSKLKMTATSQNPPFDLKMLRDGFDRCISRIVFCINICSGLVRGGRYALWLLAF